MARKIKFTSKVIKKWCLIALLVALVVGFGIIVVQSFDKDNILSNNTVLNDLDYYLLLFVYNLYMRYLYLHIR